MIPLDYLCICALNIFASFILLGEETGLNSIEPSNQAIGHEKTKGGRRAAVALVRLLLAGLVDTPAPVETHTVRKCSRWPALARKAKFRWKQHRRGNAGLQARELLTFY